MGSIGVIVKINCDSHKGCYDYGMRDSGRGTLHRSRDRVFLVRL